MWVEVCTSIDMQYESSENVETGLKRIAARNEQVKFS